MSEYNAQLRSLDRHFASFVKEAFQVVDDLTLSLFAWVSYRLGQGHTCVHLNRLPTPLNTRTDVEWQQCLAQTKAVLDISSTDSLDSTEKEQGRPLVLERNKLYLSRYHDYEKQVAKGVLARLQEQSVDISHIAPILDQLFGPVSENLDWQRVAVAGAIRKRFVIISGGPGTGKTTTVAKLLAAIIWKSMDQENNPEQMPRIALAAPTGKAAARLTESIQQAKQRLHIPEAIVNAIPEESSTLHRLLGVRSNTEGFYHNQENPLHFDWVLVDEASMVDLPMMANLMQALKEDAGLILIGDRHQLASVEAGSVLGDLCDTGRDHPYSIELQQYLADLGLTLPTANDQAPIKPQKMADSVFELRQSYRFKADSGIGVLAKAMQQKQLGFVQQWVQQASTGHEPYSDVLTCFDPHAYWSWLLDHIQRGYQAYLQAINQGKAPIDVLRAFQQFQILTAHREGDRGVQGINKALEQQWRHRGLLPVTQDQWYIGRPVMVTANDYRQQLFNGDIGICLPSSDHSDRLRVFFEAQAGEVRAVLPSRLPHHETVFAMTVHKSQGSEFEEVMLVLPEESSPVLTRELVYTGITRAKSKLNIATSTVALMDAINKAILRNSGLRDRLWQ